MNRSDSPSWLRAVAAGEPTEAMAAAWFARTGAEVLRYVGRAPADLEVRWRVECKHDLIAPRSGRVAVEVAYRGEPSGIHTSHATHWLYHVGELVFLVRTDALRELLRRGAYPTVAAGDGKLARVALVPLGDLRTLARGYLAGEGRA